MRTDETDWVPIEVHDEICAENARLVGALLTRITNEHIRDGYHYKAAQALAQSEVARVRDVR